MLFEVDTKLGSVLNFVTCLKNCHNEGSEIFRVLLKKALCASVSCWLIYTLYYVHSIKYIKVMISRTLPKIILNEKYHVFS